jgi:hypothetical protein
MLDEDTDRERRWIVCRHTKARDVEAIPPRFFELSGESGRFEFRGDVGAAKKRTPTGAAVQVVTDTKLFEVLTRLGDWTTTGRWSDAVPMPESTLKSRLARFVEDGQIERKPGPRNSFLYRVAQANETNDGRSSGGRA